MNLVEELDLLEELLSQKPLDLYAVRVQTRRAMAA